MCTPSHAISLSSIWEFIQKCEDIFCWKVLQESILICTHYNIYIQTASLYEQSLWKMLPFFVCLFVCVSVSFSWGRPPAMCYPEIPHGETMTWPHEDDSSWCWKHGLNMARSPGCCLTIGPSCHWVPLHRCNFLDPPPCCQGNHSCLNYSHSRGFRSHGERVGKDHMKRKYHSRLKN